MSFPPCSLFEIREFPQILILQDDLGSLSYILRATPSAASPFWLPGVAIRGLGASILTFWETILAPREHPGLPFWHLGTTLEDRGAAGWTRDCGLQGFTRFGGDFGTCVY